jgi:hypothetical protein
VAAYRKQPVTFVITEDSDDNTPITLTVKSGDEITVAQLQSIPYSKLINPETDTEIVSALFEIGEAEKADHFSTAPIRSTEPNSFIKKLLAEARSGDMIGIVQRKGKTKEGQIKDLPSIYYKIK